MMLKNNLLLLNLLICVFVQAQTYQWTKTVGGMDAEYASDIITDDLGNIYSTGHFKGTVDFDPSTTTYNKTSNGSYDFFILKLDANGNFEWVRTLGGSLEDQSTSLKIDFEGNIIVVGFFAGQVDFDPTSGTNYHTSNGNSLDIFILKLDESGNFIWAKTLGGTASDCAYSVELGSTTGNIYFTGLFFGTVDFDPSSATDNHTSNGSYDIFIEKLDKNGNFQWARTMGGSGYDEGISISTSDYGIYIAGHFADQTDLDPSSQNTDYHTSNGGMDIFILSIDAFGNFVWAKTFGGTNSDICSTICVSNISGYIYVSGHFYSSIDFDSGTGTDYHSPTGQHDAFVEKLDVSGNFVWVQTFGGTNKVSGATLITDAIDNVYASGFFDSTADFDPSSGVNNHTSNGYYDQYLVKLNSSGNLSWVKTIGGNGYDFASSISLDGSGNVYVVGAFDQTVDFDPELTTDNYTSNGSSDIYIWKIGCSSTTSSINIDACESYIFPSGNYYAVSSGKYTDTLVNANGCDSLITINLTITKLDTGITITGSTLSANLSGASYQWYSCNYGLLEIFGATNQSYSPTQSGSYAVKIITSDCYTYSDCYSVTISNITETNSQNLISAYPNPGTGNFTIDLGSRHEKINISVHDILGTEISKYEYRQNQLLNLNINGSEGVYFLIIQSGNERTIIKLIKE